MNSVSKLKISAALLFLAIIASLLLLLGKSSPPVSANFVSYAVASDGITPVAILKLTNPTGCPFKLPLSTDRSSAGVDQWRVWCQFSDKTATGWTNWTERAPTSGGFTSLILRPYSSLDVTVPLTPTGQPRKAAVLCIPDLRNSSQFWDKLQFWRLTHLPLHLRRGSLTKIWCDRELYSTPETNATSTIDRKSGFNPASK